MAQIEIPNDNSPTMSHADALNIKVTAQCTWCFLDPNGVFPLPPHRDALPATGTTLKPGTYHAKPIANGPDGTIMYNTSIPPDPCSAKGGAEAAMPHQIIVAG
ncbi:MAG TPA: hypothetical protein VE195_01425 [Acidobacteriaceae bacterium]|nr:hypothetical protein [Acidobacteriaceae bacterium]